jgi:hypothetical protein
MKAGRPLKYKTAEEIDEAVSSYFDKIKEEGIRPTVTGLAYHLGFESRQSMYDYQEREEFSYSIKRAVLYIESVHEANLFNSSATGSIFWLKNRDWKDKSETDITSGGEKINLPPLKFLDE